MHFFFSSTVQSVSQSHSSTSPVDKYLHLTITVWTGILPRPPSCATLKKENKIKKNPENPVLPIVPVRALGPALVRGPSPPASGDPRRDEAPLRSVSSGRPVRAQQLTVDVQAREHGKHRAQQECTNVTPHCRVCRRDSGPESWHGHQRFNNKRQAGRHGDALPGDV